MQISVTETDSMAIKSCGSDSHGVTMRDPSPRHYTMAPGRNLDLLWMKKVADGGVEADDQVVSCSAQWTNDKREWLIGVAI